MAPLVHIPVSCSRAAPRHRSSRRAAQIRCHAPPPRRGRGDGPRNCGAATLAVAGCSRGPCSRRHGASRRSAASCASSRNGRYGTGVGRTHEGVYRTRLDEPLLPTAGLVGVGRDRDFLRRRRSAHLAAPDAPAAEPLLPEPRPCSSAEVAVPRARDDQFCRNVPLDSLEADALREERFCVGDKIDRSSSV